MSFAEHAMPFNTSLLSLPSELPFLAAARNLPKANEKVKEGMRTPGWGKR